MQDGFVQSNSRREKRDAERERSEVEKVVTDWARAVSEGDRNKILAHHADDVRMFDFPDTAEGLEAYDKTWDFFFDNQLGPITFAPSDIRVTAGQDVAFVSCNMHCDGTTAGPLDFRLTMGLEKRDGQWVITHEHHSLPTVD
ncbi:MAG TPA: nuclear transport factor 2 family protein [Sphingomicrobium sp.]